MLANISELVSDQGSEILRVFVTGGAGYIGSHTIIELLESGHDVMAVDNFSNSKSFAIENIKRISGKKFVFFEADVTNFDHMVKLLSDFRPDKVIHFAGQKSVNESVNNPKFYHEQNVGGTKTLLSALAVCECDNIIFSSSAAVYGKTEALPINEMHQPCPANPYGETKLAAEKAIFKWVGESAGRSSVLLRYFNPVGAHSSGKIGENPSGPPSNLFPSIMRVAAGIWPDLEIYGDDYDTPDGTALRDYVHITDLVSGHLAALEFSQNNLGTNIFNLGTGKAKSVLEILRAFESATGQIIPFKIKARRPGDTAFCCADPSRARKHLKWSSKKSLSEMCRDAWRWQLHSMN